MPVSPAQSAVLPEGRASSVNEMLEKLAILVNEVTNLNSKLVLLVGEGRSGKSALLRALAERFNSDVLNVGAILGRALLPVSQKQRALQIDDLWRDIAARHTSGAVLLLDDIELLFDHTLRLDPVALLKRQAHGDRVVAVWPGELRAGRLQYAKKGHPEYRDSGLEGIKTFQVQ